MKTQHRGTAVVALLLALTACGGGGGSKEESSAPTTLKITDSPNVTTGDTEDTPGEPASGSLRVGVATDLQTLDPQRAQPAQLHYLDLVYDSLTGVAADGTVVPRLASSVTSEDLTTWNVTLADGATFADGSPVDSAAVVYSFERGKSIAESPSAPSFAEIASVEAIDDTHLTITLERPNVAFARDMAGLPGMIVDPASEGSDLSRDPAGAGPYEFDGGGSMEGAEYRYSLRDDYWGDGVGVTEITLALMADPTARVNALQSGELDIAAELGPADQSKLGDAYELVMAPTSEPVFLQVIDTDGTVVPALGDPQVRQAMSYAIDREGIRDAVFFGGGVATTAWFPSGSPYYSESVDGVGYDPEKARALLEEAGYGDGFEFDTPTVEPLRTVTEAVAASLAEIGITMNVELQQPGTLGEQMRNGEWPAGVTITRGQTPQAFYAERFGPGAPFNAFDADRTPVVELGEQALAATDVSAANQLWAETYAEAVEQGYVIVVGHVTSGSGIASDVTGAQVPYGSLLPDLRAVRVDG
jgi:peptide/nickel transport system substrate-binding protein